MYLLDTDVLTAYYNKEPDAIRQIGAIPESQRLTSVICVWESVRGSIMALDEHKDLYFKGKQNSFTLALRDFLGHVTFLRGLNIMPYDDNSEEAYKRLPAELKTKKRQNDSRIAATAIANGLVVATRNYEDFNAYVDYGLGILDCRIQRP
jgi:predicted nucleic acid-binding protein